MRKIVGWLLVLSFLGALFIAWLIFIRMGEGGVTPSEVQDLAVQLIGALGVAVLLLGIAITLWRRGARHNPNDCDPVVTEADLLDGQPKPISKSKSNRRKSVNPRRKSQVKNAKHTSSEPLAPSVHPRRGILRVFFEWSRARDVAKQEALPESEARAERSHTDWLLQHPEYAFHFKPADTAQDRSAFRNLSRRGIVMTNQTKRIGQSTFTNTRNSGTQTAWHQPVGIVHNIAAPNYTHDLLRRRSQLGLSVDLARRGGLKRNRSQMAAKATFDVAKVRPMKIGGGYHSLISPPYHLTGPGSGQGLGKLASTLQVTPSLAPPGWCVDLKHWLDINKPNSDQWRRNSLKYFDDCMS